jgi:hypothetical protein
MGASDGQWKYSVEYVTDVTDVTDVHDLMWTQFQMCVRTGWGSAVELMQRLAHRTSHCDEAQICS